MLDDVYIQRKEWPLFGFWGPDWTLWQDLFIRRWPRGLLIAFPNANLR